tara:strand:+ start:151 stop:291 length:141 start_codon:yes stop_codon:yes gene_type:complete
MMIATQVSLSILGEIEIRYWSIATLVVTEWMSSMQCGDLWLKLAYF